MEINILPLYRRFINFMGIYVTQLFIEHINILLSNIFLRTTVAIILVLVQATLKTLCTAVTPRHPI